MRLRQVSRVDDFDTLLVADKTVAELDLHGVVQPLACEARLTRTTDGRLTVETAFAVKLSDHAIDRPKFLVMKLADEQQVKVTLVLRPEARP